MIDWLAKPDHPHLRTIVRSGGGLLRTTMATSIDTEVDAHAAHLRSQAQAFCDQVSDALRPRVTTGREAYAFLRRL